jgi:type VI protein secretion system component Hcp
MYGKIVKPAVLGLVLACSIALAPRPASAQKVFLLTTVETTQGTIMGDSTVKGHVGWIEVQSAALGNLVLNEQNSSAIASAASGGGTGKASFHDITIHKTTDSASPSLFQAASKSALVKRVVVECLNGNPMQATTVHRLTITGGTLSVRHEGPGKEAIIFVGGHVTYN